MLPVVFDRDVRAGVVGAGEGLRRRLAMLADAGIAPPAVLKIAPDPRDLAGLHLLFVAGLDKQASAAVAQTARTAGVPVNVEDEPGLCDFHVPAQIRRGELLLTVSTGGKSPGLSKALREELEQRFGPEWSERLDQMARLRDAWRKQGVSAEAVSSRTRDHIAASGWL